MDNEMRYDPILKEWVIVAKNRTVRPVLGKSFEKKKKTWTCPFCPDAPEGAGNWVVKWVPNRFPSLIDESGMSFKNEELVDNFYKKRPGKGRCEVILFTQDHEKTLGDLTIHNIEALIKLWQERQEFSMRDPEFKYTFIFENRGEIIGVSISHPHGQLYTFPFIPPKINKALQSANEYMENNDSCLYCEIISVEKEDGSRIIVENDDFISFIPYFAKWPFEIHIYPKKHVNYINGITDSNAVTNFAKILKKVVKKLDGLYGFTMPYVMSHHNAPYNCGNVNGYHYHIEIYPPYRGKDRVKYLAGVELGTNTIINPTNPSENAEQLRNVEID
ncbi:MAG: galactose-1-phosphate uridylyltransferase [Candidatus Lokiarchaeota archaeon]|nr:galactose-1-phosphate uridylyltransferase [Candidatus Lokiarchaeota archaeon]